MFIAKMARDDTTAGLGKLRSALSFLPHILVSLSNDMLAEIPPKMHSQFIAALDDRLWFARHEHQMASPGSSTADAEGRKQPRIRAHHVASTLLNLR
jgi:hypothetical protein